MDARRFQRLKDQIETLTREESEAKGGLVQVQSTLEKEFGCKKAEQAESLLIKLEKEQIAAEKEYDEALAEFESRWKERIMS